MGCYIWYCEEGTGWGLRPPRPLLAIPNVTAHPSTASTPITVLLYIMVRCCAVLMCPHKGLIIGNAVEHQNANLLNTNHEINNLTSL